MFLCLFHLARGQNSTALNCQAMEWNEMKWNGWMVLSGLVVIKIKLILPSNEIAKHLH